MGKVHDIQVREAQSEEKEQVLEVVLDAYRQYEKELPEQLWEQYKASIQASIIDGQPHAPHAHLVAVQDGRIIGSVQLYLSSEEAYGRADLGIESPIIRLLSVAPSARGKGVATLLIQESARRALSLGSTSLYLHTSDMMLSAVRLYERLGFERAYDKEFHNGNALVKSYRLLLRNHPLLAEAQRYTTQSEEDATWQIANN